MLIVREYDTGFLYIGPYGVICCILYCTVFPGIIVPTKRVSQRQRPLSAEAIGENDETIILFLSSNFKRRKSSIQFKVEIGQYYSFSLKGVAFHLFVPIPAAPMFDNRRLPSDTVWKLESNIPTTVNVPPIIAMTEVM